MRWQAMDSTSPTSPQIVNLLPLSTSSLIVYTSPHHTAKLVEKRGARQLYLLADLPKKISLRAATTNPQSISPDPPPPPQILHRSHLISLRRRWLGAHLGFPT